MEDAGVRGLRGGFGTVMGGGCCFCSFPATATSDAWKVRLRPCSFHFSRRANPAVGRRIPLEGTLRYLLRRARGNIDQHVPAAVQAESSEQQRLIADRGLLLHLVEDLSIIDVQLAERYLQHPNAPSRVNQHLANLKKRAFD